MLTGKQKRYLRSLGVTMEPVLMIGKGGIGDMVIRQALDALAARELIKGRVLGNALAEVDEVAVQLAERCGAELVQIIGHNFLLYKRNEEEPKIELPQ